MNNQIYDVVIIGSGPAAYTAAIYTSRAFLKTMIIAGPEPGGQLTTTTEVENFPGFPDGIGGTVLVQQMKKQANKFGTEMIMDEAVSCQLAASSKKKLFEIKATNNIYQGRSVIIATGARAKRLGIPTEEQFRGKGISYCATCDGFFFRGKDIAVLGGGDTAMEEATFLTKFASHVTIIHRRSEFKASPIMLEKARKDAALSFLLNKVVDEFYGDSLIRGIKLRDVKTGKINKVSFDGVFVAIGHEPNTAFLKGFLELDEKGYVIIRQKNGQDAGKNIMLHPQTSTSVSGIFAAGDCVDPRYRQAIVASGMGCMAAIDVQKWLDNEI